MAIADTITSMQNHTSNAYTMIGYGTDLTGINKNLENLSTSIFNAFLEALRNSDTLFTNLPKKSGTGANITLNGTANAPMRIELGASELTQVQTIQGDNLFDENYYNNSDLYTAGSSYNYVLTNIKGNRTLYFKAQLKSGKTKINNLVVCFTDYGANPDRAVEYVSVINYGTARSVTSSYSPNTIYLAFQPTSVSVADIFDAYDIWVSTNDIEYEPFVPNSPSPNYPQDIHTISGSNTIKVEGRNLMNTNVLFQEMQDYSFNVPQRVIVDGRNCIEFQNNWYHSANFYQIGYKENTLYTFRVMARVKDTSITSGYTLYMGVRYTDNTISSASIPASGSTWQEIRFVTNASKTVKSLYFTYGSGTLWYIDEDSFNIIEGDTTEYSPHTLQEANIDLRTYTNLFDEKTMIPKKTINTSGEIADYDTTGASEQYIKVEPNTQYTFNCSNSYTLRVNKYTSNKTHIERIEQANSSSFSFTTNNNCYYIRVSFYAGIAVTQELLDNLHFWVNKGATALSYTPYNDIEYCKIENYEDKFIRTSGKNKANYTNITPASTRITITSTSTGFDYTITDMGGSGSGAIIPVNLVNGEQYILNFNKSSGVNIPNIRLNDTINFDSNYQSISDGVSFTANKNHKYLRIWVLNSNNGGVDSGSFTNLQLKKGSTTSNFEPYGSNEWYIKKNIGKVVLDGSETWNYSSGSSAFYTDIANLNYLTSNNVPICTHYKGKANVSGPGSLGNNEIAFYNGASPSRVYIKDTNYSDTTSYKSWLSSNNVIADYIRANPEYLPITGTLETQLENVYKNMLSQAGQTNISQVNNDLSFELSVSAIEELESVGE